MSRGGGTEAIAVAEAGIEFKGLRAPGWQVRVAPAAGWAVAWSGRSAGSRFHNREPRAS
jgi:hypothetical protein